ncbi:MBOAT, membrane-bound O-acyltransferase family-domain-containing protein, partial [Globomyces pollinis-pini]
MEKINSNGYSDQVDSKSKLDSVHSIQIHRSRVSPLSRDASNQNFRGFFNLSILLLAVSNFRLMLGNFLRFGFLVGFPTISIHERDILWSLTNIFLQIGPIVFTYLLEWNLVKQSFKSSNNRILSNYLQILNIMISFTVSCFISYFKIWHPLASVAPLLSSIVLSLKLTSYSFVNSELWYYAKTVELAKKNDIPVTVSLPYPANISLYNLVYFIIAPTLCYQPIYPKTERISTTFLLKRLCELFISVLGMYFLAVQYLMPVLEDCIREMDDSRHIHLVERILKLSIVSVGIWLLGFYAIFHSWLNFLAELLQFGDREFYKAWWNAKDISEYWRLWNAPVHHWCKRHVFRPLISYYKVNPMIAVFCVFTVSAILHEVLVGIPTHNLNGFAFWGMMLQIPLIVGTYVVNKIRAKFFGSHTDSFFDTIGKYLSVF